MSGMRWKIKSYLVFTSFWYRILVFGVLPVLLIGLQFLPIGEWATLRNIGTVMVLIMIEAVADYWYLGGIQDKDVEKIDYLKTSPRGMDIMRNALRFDLVRRLLAAAAVLGVSELVGWGGRERNVLGGAGVWLLLTLICYTLSVTATLIARFNSYLWINYLTGYVGMIIALIFYFILCVWTAREVMIILTVVFLALAVGISFLAVRVAMKKVEGSYYDK